MGKEFPLKNLKHDFPAGLVVFLVALPLCIGIALASGASAFSGIVSGIAGGIVIGLISGSPLSVSGPAAGLTGIVLTSVETLDNFNLFLAAVVLSGVFQIVFGILRAGKFGQYIPSSVIKGMLAAIGIILIMKQIPHALGYDSDYEGDESFLQNDGHNTFSEIIYSTFNILVGPTIVAIISISILLFFESKFIRDRKLFQFIPGALVVVLVSIWINNLFKLYLPGWEITGNHLVDLPLIKDKATLVAEIHFPDFSTVFEQKEIILLAFTLAIVASLESLLSLEATDRLDPQNRVSPPNRELIAQGCGNIAAGSLGGIPVTSVVVRSSANIASGGKTKLATIIHGVLLAVSVLLFPHYLNLIPKSALAAVLLLIGYKLTKTSLFVEMYKKGRTQFVPFIVTVTGIYFTNLLLGILIGISVGIYFVLKNNFRAAVYLSNSGENYLLKLNKDVSFLNKPLIKSLLRTVPDNSHLLIDGSNANFIDADIKEEIEDFSNTLAIKKNITITKRNYDKS